MHAPIEGGGERVRQWRLRQANGNQITFRELTTLQRWIVERKLSRDDEISLDGEIWKQLGSINELSSFFQRVDQAQRASLLEQSSREPAATVPKETTSPPIPPKEVPSVVVSPNEPPKSLNGPSSNAPRDSRASANRGLFIVLLLAFLGGVSYLAYRYFVWVPQRQRQEQHEASKRSSAPPAPGEISKLDQLASETALPPKVSALPTASDSAPAKVDEPEPAQPSAGEMGNPPPQSSSKPEEAAHFDSYMDKADRLREREQPRAALQAYQKAHELEPARPEPLAGSGLALLDLGRTAPAIAAFEQALKIDRRHGIALMGLAEAYRAEGKKEQAVRYYERYLAVVPDGPEAQVAKAAIEALQE